MARAGRRILGAAALVAVAGIAGWVLSAPRPLPQDALAGVTGDPARGAVVMAAAGCVTCHTAPDAAPADPPILAGGRSFVSGFGTFRAPNISSDPVAGIGAWSDHDIAQAMLRGVSPGGSHYYPAFPYVAYQNMTAQDAADLIAYLRTLPADATPSRPHEVGLPFSIRRAIGLWKRLFGAPGWTVTGPLSPEAERGRYLVEALAHCGECHTPRNALGGLDRSRWLAGAPNPAGEGRIPDITPGRLQWTEEQIAEYLLSGFTPSFDIAGGEMAEVIRNTARLPQSDRLAIAAYLKALPGPQ